MNAIRIVFSSLWTAARYPRVWLTAWLVVTLPAVLLVWPALSELRAAFDHHPGAEFALGQHLDADFARLNAEAKIRAGGALLFMMLTWTFLGGGILATVGTDRKFTCAEFLTESARLFLRNLRVVLVGAVLALLMFWGAGVLDRWLLTEVLYDADPSPIDLFGYRFRVMTPEFGLEALAYVWGGLFVVLLFTSKLARARLQLDDRRSALVAWWRAGVSILFHPIRSGLIVASLIVAWMVPVWALGLLLERALEGSGNLWLGLAISQVIVVWIQVVLIGFFLAARGYARSLRKDAVDAIEPTGSALPRTTPIPATEVITDLPRS